jgi:UDP-N-acetylglucosamine 2-epimerase
VCAEVRDPAVLGPLGERLGVPLAPGSYSFATVHRQENREPGAIAAWAAILASASSPDRPLVLALHPGTKVALDRAGISCGPDVVIVEPQGYRTSLALQLHAAAVLTDSGGIQREAAWLGVPCLVLRESTEWTEAVDGSGGRMVIVGLDRAKVAVELARLAPPGGAERLARDRAVTLDLRPAGAAAAISAALESAGEEPR